MCYKYTKPYEFAYTYVIHRLGGPYWEKLNSRSWAPLNTSPNTNRPRPVNNIFIFFPLRFKSFRKFHFGLQTMCVEVGRVYVDEDTTIRLLQTVSIASEISLCGNFANSNFRPGEISQVRIFDVAKFRGCEFSLRRNFGKTKVTFASVDAKFQQDESEISLG